jgi:hypothetical protein
MNAPLRLRTLLAAALAAMALGACGGDDHNEANAGGSANTGTDIPASATASVDGLLAYVNTLIASSSDTSEPVNVGNAVLPTSDTTEAAN